MPLNTTGDPVMIAAGCVSTWVIHWIVPVCRSTEITFAPLCACLEFGMSPKITWFPSTAGLTRDTAPSTPSYSEILCDQISRPVSFLTAQRLPPQSGKKTASPSTVGVAETSPPVVNTHFGARPLTLAGLTECSAGWFQLLLRFCPAIRHWPDRDSSDLLCAPSATANKSTISAAFGNDASRFFLGICIVLPKLILVSVKVARTPSTAIW